MAQQGMADPRPLVAVVDADPDNRALELRLLQVTERYQLCQATDGPGGLALVRRRQPALVLLDLDLPGLDAFAALRDMRAEPTLARTPVVALSASVMQGERQRCNEVGFDAFVEKPFDIHELRQLVQRLLGGQGDQHSGDDQDSGAGR